jgi:hypothetical protein
MDVGPLLIIGVDTVYGRAGLWVLLIVSRHTVAINLPGGISFATA